jgi:hypothetical protein
MRGIVLGAAALAFSAASVSADGYSHVYRHHYGYHYGYATPVFDYTGNAYYGFPPPSYIHASWPIHVAVPIHGRYGWR